MYSVVIDIYIEPYVTWTFSINYSHIMKFILLQNEVLRRNIKRTSNGKINKQVTLKK